MGKRWWIIVGSLWVIGSALVYVMAQRSQSLIPLAHASDVFARLTPTTVALSTADYPIGDPTLTDLWVDPINGADHATGADREHPLRTVTAAWQRIPAGTPLSTTGYRIQLLPGDYPEDSFPEYWEDRHGSADFPIILQAAEGAGTVRLLGDLNLFLIDYFYLLEITVQHEFDLFHCERCSYLLLRNNTFLGSRTASHENIKINQSQHIYLEANDIDGAEQNAVDFVAVQYGHIRNNHIHNADDWCIYLKGGSAYFRIEGNEIDTCGTGGFTAGEGTGFEYMISPWLHYEAYDLKVVNNLIHDTEGAGLGVHGGYNILYAFNTLYRIGGRSHLVEVGVGSRTCDGDTTLPMRCANHLAAGGWGTTTIGSEGEPIPNRHVYIYNNIFYNPAGSQSQWQHVTIDAPRTPGPASNIGAPAQSDEDLVLRGNLIWNGPPDHPSGLGEATGCQLTNATCNITQLMADNTINTVEPALLDPASGDFRPIANGNLFRVTTFAIPAFTSWASLSPAVPLGTLENDIPADRAGFSRTATDPPGAYRGDASASVTVTPSATHQAVATSSSILYLPAVRNGYATPSPTATLLATVPTHTATPTATARPRPTATANATDQPLPPGPLTIVTLGDSLTEGQGDERADGGGYPARLLSAISTQRPHTTLTNVAHAGWTSDDLIHGSNGEPAQLTAAVNQLSAAAGAKLALVWIGSNDLWYLYEYNDPTTLDELADQQHFRANLELIFSQLRATGATVAVALLDDQSQRPVVANPPTPSEPAFPGISEEERLRMAGQVAAYNEIIRNRAAAHSAVLVDFYTTTIFTTAATLADDGNHPNANGYDAIAAQWQSAIAPLLTP